MKCSDSMVCCSLLGNRVERGKKNTLLWPNLRTTRKPLAFRTEIPQTHEKLRTSSDGAAKTKRNLPLLAALENIVKNRNLPQDKGAEYRRNV
jgi:hypothetical protein